MKATKAKAKAKATKNNPTITYFSPGVARKWKEEWFEDSKLHRIDGPAIREWDLRGKLIREEWYKNGESHRIDGPAIREWGPDGRLAGEYWHQNDKLHCTEKDTFGNAIPAYQTWRLDGTLSEQLWYVNGNRHRTDGPARLSWTNAGVQTALDWYCEGKLHNLNGPARWRWNSKGCLEFREFWVDGILYSNCLARYSATEQYIASHPGAVVDLARKDTNTLPGPAKAVPQPEPVYSARQNIPTELTIEGVRYISVDHLLRNINIDYLLRLSKK